MRLAAVNRRAPERRRLTQVVSQCNLAAPLEEPRMHLVITPFEHIDLHLRVLEWELTQHGREERAAQRRDTSHDQTTRQPLAPAAGVVLQRLGLFEKATRRGEYSFAGVAGGQPAAAAEKQLHFQRSLKIANRERNSRLTDPALLGRT